MFNMTLCEIPVYPCSQEEFERRTRDKVSRFYDTAPVRGRLAALTAGIASGDRMRGIRYTGLIGIIEIHVAGTQLSADCWFTDKRVLLSTSRRTHIRWRGPFLEMQYAGSAKSSSEIFIDFDGALALALKRHALLARRHVDLTAFRRAGPHIDWRALMELARDPAEKKTAPE